MKNTGQKLSNKKVEEIIRDSGFNISHTKVEEKRDAIFVSKDEIGLSKLSLRFLEDRGINSLWTHQANAIKESIKGNNICVTTSTSSGKTEIFQLSAIEVLGKKKTSKVLTIYPMKALNRQQLERWEKTGYSIGKIDGDTTDIKIREQVLIDSRIVIMTPDVMHTFLLGKINDVKIGKSIKDFIKNVSLVIIDELHLYKGVFGTNSAYLFRRFNNLHRLLCKKDCFAQYVTASATLPNAKEHSSNITGVPNFVEIGIKQDASPISEKTFYFIEINKDAANKGKGMLTDLVSSFSKIDDAKSITFVESRQKTGDMASLDVDNSIFDNVEETGIYPYRAGYEKETIDNITRNLHDGKFKGIVSTSALEIGIDIKGLNIVIIADMPQDKNSYQQRIGRVGRFGCETSFVIIVRGDSFSSQLLFDEYNNDIDKVLPNYEPALYLEDKNVQNIHALCHIGDTEVCECLQWKGRVNTERSFDGEGYFPNSFVTLCQDILSGQTTRTYDEIKVNNPHYAYPIRFFGKQYVIMPCIGEKKCIPMESISREQICTEGYVGAVRNTMYGKMNIKERIVNINLVKEEIHARQEYNKYIRTQSFHRKYLVPNFKEEYRNGTIYYGDTKIYNLKVTEYRTIYGYKELKGRGLEYHQYDVPFYLPELETTGTIIFHPSFNNNKVNTSIISKIIFEAFLKRNAFDRNDISFIGGKLYSNYERLSINDKFVSLYDVSSLNITNRIINEELIDDLFVFLQKHLEVIALSLFPEINNETIKAIKELCKSIIDNKANISFQNVGNEYSYKPFTEIIYIKEDPITGLQEEMIGIYTGLGNIPNTFNIFVNGEGLSNISKDDVKPTVNTKYEAMY